MDDKQIHKGHRKRVKEEFRGAGLEHFSRHRVLELLLFYAVPQGDTNPAAHRLIERFGSLSAVLDAPIELLMEVEGVGVESATLLKLLPALARAYLDDKASAGSMLRSTADAKEYVAAKFLGEENERLLLVCLGTNGKILFTNWLASGDGRSVEASPARVVSVALRCGATKVVLAHNHPNGFCNPSSRDLRTTSILMEELRRLGVELFDHVIVGADGVCSLAEMGFR